MIRFSRPLGAMRPLEAYEALLRFFGRRGNAAFRLAMHAAVPQSLRPDLLHLLKLNFIPEAIDDWAVESDVLLAPFCDNLGGGYYQFDSEVRRLLLDHLEETYASDGVPRVRRVAEFLLHYVEHTERRSPTVHDRLGREFLETQRWVGLAFAHPEEATAQLAAALREAQDDPAMGVRLHLSGLAYAVALPLAHQRDLLSYALLLNAIDQGEREVAAQLLRTLHGREITAGGITLRPSSILHDIQEPLPGESEDDGPGLAGEVTERTGAEARSYTAAEVWSRILEASRTALPEPAYRTWLAPIEAVAISQDLLVVSTPNPFAVEWVEQQYGPMLAEFCNSIFGRRLTLSVQFRASGKSAAVPPTPVEIAPTAPVTATQSARSMRTVPLNPRYTFARFVVGPGNQLAAAAAHAVAEAPAKHYNPLFIYGDVGLGKSHLMHAIGNSLLDREPGRRVMYLSSERFTNELVSAIQDGSMAEFRRQYRQIDLLLVDDIQFLEGKERTQEEFFHTFNALHDAQRQIVLTSDRPPKEIGLDTGLVSRFEWGLEVEIQRPDFEERMAILRRKVEEDGLVIRDTEDVLTLIAYHRTSSVREIEGALIKLMAYASMTGGSIDLSLAQEALGGVPMPFRSADGTFVRKLSPELVREKVADAFATTIEALQSKKRRKDLTVPRQVAMYLTRELFDLPLVEIGKLFGGRDHSTVIHSIAKVEEDMATDPAFRQRVDAIRGSLR